MTNDKYEQRLKKKQRLERKLNNKVEILKKLLNTNNIMYINIKDLANDIEDLKYLINNLNYELDIYSDT